MTINLTFNDLDEMEAAILRMAENIESRKIFQTGVPEPQEEPEEIPAKADKNPEKTEKTPEPSSRRGRVYWMRGQKNGRKNKN